jgi:hypothetical protein
MNKPDYEEEKWHTCHPLSVAENNQEYQDDGYSGGTGVSSTNLTMPKLHISII